MSKSVRSFICVLPSDSNAQKYPNNKINKFTVEFDRDKELDDNFHWYVGLTELIIPNKIKSGTLKGVITLDGTAYADSERKEYTVETNITTTDRSRVLKLLYEQFEALNRQLNVDVYVPGRNVYVHETDNISRLPTSWSYLNFNHAWQVALGLTSDRMNLHYLKDYDLEDVIIVDLVTTTNAAAAEPTAGAPPPPLTAAGPTTTTTTRIKYKVPRGMVKGALQYLRDEISRDRLPQYRLSLLRESVQLHCKIKYKPPPAPLAWDDDAVLLLASITLTHRFLSMYGIASEMDVTFHLNNYYHSNFPTITRGAPYKVVVRHRSLVLQQLVRLWMSGASSTNIRFRKINKQVYRQYDVKVKRSYEFVPPIRQTEMSPNAYNEKLKSNIVFKTPNLLDTGRVYNTSETTTLR